MSNGLQQVINYMIPAVGTPRGYFWTGIMDADPETIDFRAVSGGGIDGQPFRPSGVFIDNTRGTAPVALVINEIGYQIICLAGELLNVQFPAPVDVSVTWTGFGEVTMVFVDFPVLPYRNLSSNNQNILWGNITGTLADQVDLNAALLARILFPAGGDVGKFLAYQSPGIAQWLDVLTAVAVQEEGSTVASSGTINFVGAGATVTDVGGVPTVDIPGGGSGADMTARAGATRFVVPGTYVDPSETESVANRDALRMAGFTSSNAGVNNATISGLDAINQFSSYIALNFATLPASGSVVALRMENFSAGDSLIWLKVNSNGSVAINNDRFFNEITSASGVIVAGITHDIIVSLDFSAPGQPVKVFVDGALVISDVAGSDLASSASGVTYQVATLGPASADGVYSRAAIFSGLLSDAEAAELSASGDPQTFVPSSAVLRAYWLLDEGAGTTAAATIGGANLALNGSGAGWGTIGVTTELAVGTPVRVTDSGATGDFATHENDIAVKTQASWDFLAPVEGWHCYDQSSDVESQWDSSAWTPTVSGGGSPWEVIGGWTYSTDVAEVDFIDLAGYADITIVGEGITLSASAVRALRVSHDNGATFNLGATSYLSITNAGIPSAFSFLSTHITAASTARAFIVTLNQMNITSDEKTLVATGGETHKYVGSTAPINAVRIFGTAGANLTGGRIAVYGRK